MAHCLITPQALHTICFEVSRIDLRFEHKVLKDLRSVKPRPGRWLIAVSGGVDSLAVAEVLWRWRRLLKIELVVAHVHHGRDSNGDFRDRAREHVRRWCCDRRVKFISNPQVENLGLKGEAQLREFRHRALRGWGRQLGASHIVMAHHADDLLETRVLRLIRGVGVGGLGAMRLRRGILLRPLLHVSRAEIEAYARAVPLEWVEDPTNRLSEEALRNWVRHEWLHQLEARQKGATKAMARSLENLAVTRENTADFPLNAYVGLRRKPIRDMASSEKASAVRQFLRAMGLQSYGRTHVEEIVKRLCMRRREFTFELLGLRFEVTPDLMWASRV